MNYEELETLDGQLPTTDLPEDEFELLCDRLAAAKAKEAKANKERIDAEAALLAFVPSKTEGTATRSGGAYKLTVTYSINRTLDAAALESARSAMKPELFEQAITYKPAIVLPGLRSLQQHNPQAYALLAQAITAKPGKPSVKLEPVTNTNPKE